MKINKKLLVPVFATAMGLSVMGGIGGAVAWYQYNTKVSASYVGVTTADGGVLQISKGDSKWGRDAYFADDNAKLHPVTFGDLGSNLVLPSSGAKKHPHAGVADPALWDDAQNGVDYYQIDLYVKALKLVDGEYKQISVPVYAEDLVLEAVTADKTDIGEALRVHIDVNSGTSTKLLSPTAQTGTDCPLFGILDLDRSGDIDKVGGYQWEENYDQDLIYGVPAAEDPTTYKPYQVTEDANTFVDENNALFVTSATAEVHLQITVWLEGWHKVAFGSNAASSIWDADKGDGSSIHFGLKLGTPKDSFLAD